MSGLHEDIEARLAGLDPRLELLAIEQPSHDALRLYIDHPNGVDLALCERVTEELRDLLLDFSLEVSSPGEQRPLTKPEHFRRFRGRRVRVRTGEVLAGRRSFTGTIADADEVSVCVDLGESSVRIPHERIRRSNLVPDIESQRKDLR